MNECKCPRCNGTNIKKNGIKYGKQQYQCKDCKKYFSGDFTLLKEPSIPCIYCGGHTNKSGKTKWGVQIYYCRDCRKRFNENTMPHPPIEEKCPYCGGDLKYKGWSNNGHKRRYLCKQCGKGFSGDLSNLQVREVEMPCPYCGSEDIKKGGHLRSGARRYVCNSCGKSYNKNTIVKKIHKPKECPQCGKMHINLSGHDTKTGKQRYKCVSCGYKFVENPTQQKFVIQEKQCPVCGYVGAKRAGRTGGKRQYYQCLNCNHKYLENGHHRHSTLKEKEQIVSLCLKGLPLIKIAKMIGKNERTVSTIIKMNKPEEKLNKEQYDLIYKYGVVMKIQPEYVAPYIPCSLKKCKEVIQELSNKNLNKIKLVKANYQVSEKDRKFDWMELDKFVG